MKYKIYNQDVVEWAKSYEKQKFHALLSDAPYELNFMGQKWDRSGVAFRPETWEAICEHLYPGAFGMVFSASRNWHRLAVAIEDAGMIIHPTIFGWLNGQGFPKATNISKQVDRDMGLEPVKGKLRTDGRGKDPLKTVLRKEGDTGIGHADGSHQHYYEEHPASDNAKMWEGHRYGLQALKPAVEPIIVFQKPYEGKPLDNIVETGAGALNIDGGRIAVDAPVTINRFTNGAKPWGDAKGEEFDTVSSVQGRWPANFILDELSAELLDAQSGITKSTGGKGDLSKYPKYDGHTVGSYLSGERAHMGGLGDSGGASRFFYNVQEQIDEADPIYYCSKVSPKERNAGLDDRCIHPTMKPIALAKYLATLLLPPEGYAPRRILVPFSGVASEMIGCIHAGWEHIVGIEFTQEYIELAEKRIEYWKDRK